MILQCSECQARFLVPDTAIGAAGRTVRCGRCQHSWFQAAAADFSERVLGELDKMIQDVNAKPLPSGSNLPAIRRDFPPVHRIAAMVAMGAVAAALLLLLVYPRALGFPRSSELGLADVGITRLTEDKRTAYEINGKIANTSTTALRSPNIRITLVDDQGAALQYWDFSSEGKVIEGGDSLPFDTGKLDVSFSRASRFVVDLGNPLELALRRKPE